MMLGVALLAICGVGTASAASGTIAVPDTRTNALAASISFTASGGDLASYQLERRSSTMVDDVCTSYGSWGSVGPVGPTSPWADTSIADGNCYEYRLRITDTGATTTYATSAGIVRVDRTAPTGFIDAAPVGPFGGWETFTGSAVDGGTGVASADLMYSGPSSGTACASMGVFPWSCDFNATSLPDGIYTLELAVTDRAGNVGSTITRTVMIDNTAPTGSVSFTEITNPQYLHSSGTVLYYNSSQGSSFRLNVAAADAGSGVDRVVFPTLGSGWSPTSATDNSAPFEQTYTVTTSSQSGARQAVVHDFAGRSRNVAFTLTPDSAAPTMATFSTNTTGTITFPAAADGTGSGVASVQLQRMTATDTSGVCGTYGSYVNVGAANPTSPYVDTTIPAGTCARYQFLVTDNVGRTVTRNNTTVNRAPAVDTTPPVTAFGSFTEVINPQYQHIVGSTLWYNPAQSGSFSVGVTATDAASGMNRVDFPGFGTGWTGGPTSDTLGPYANTYTFTAGAANPGLQTFAAFDNAANTSTNTFTVSADSTAPTGGSIIAGYGGGSSASVSFTQGSDAASGVGSWAIERRQTTHSGTCNVGSWGTWIQVGAANPAAPYTDASITDGSCYEYRLRMTDNVDNTTTVAGNVIEVPAPAAAAVNVTASSPTVTEGGASATYTLVLSRQPTANVVVTFGAGSQLTTDMPTRTFTTSNWAVPQTVTVEAVDDSVSEGPHVASITHAVSSGDAAFNGLSIASVSVSIIDNDAAGITVGGGTVSVNEAGATTDTFHLVLTSQPTADVTISLAPDAQVTASPAAVTFTASNWNTPQFVTIAAVDDMVDEADPHAGTVAMTVSSLDVGYDGFVLSDVAVIVGDDDSAGVLVSRTTATVAEGGSTEAFDVSLASPPGTNVNVYVNGDVQVATAPATLTFTPADWNVPQTVTIEAVDDYIDEATHLGLITFSTVSSDPAFDGVFINDILVDITDNDVAGIVTTPSTGLLVAEGGASSTFDLVLTSEPTADVTVATAGGGQVATSPATTTFTPANWNVVQTVTVTAIDDTVDEADPHAGLVTFVATSVDPNYAALALANIDVDVTDNDDPLAPDPTPPHGGSISVPNLVTNATSLPVTFAVGSDVGSGIASWHVERRVAIYGGGGCTVFDAWKDVSGASPASPFVDSFASQQCVAYRLVVTDHAGNTTIYNDDDVLRIDRGNPFGSIDEAGPAVSRFDGMASDLGSNTVTVDVRVSGPVSFEACSNLRVTGGMWNCTFDDSNLVNGSYTITSTMRDEAGNVMTATRPWERFVRVAVPITPGTPPRAPQEETPVAPRDTVVPQLKKMTLAPISYEGTAELGWEASDNSGDDPVVRVERRAAKARGSWSRWTVLARDAVAPIDLRTGVRGSTTCVRLVATDAAGNETSSPVKCTTVPLDDRSFAVTRYWTRALDTEAFAGTTTVAPRWSAATMSTRVGSFSSLKLVAATCSTCGTVKVYVGSRVAATVSLRSRRANPRAVIALRIPARPKGGVIALRPVSGSGAVAIDGLVVARS